MNCALYILLLISLEGTMHRAPTFLLIILLTVLFTLYTQSLCFSWADTRSAPTTNDYSLFTNDYFHISLSAIPLVRRKSSRLFIK